MNIKAAEAVSLAAKVPFFAGLKPSQMKELMADAKVKTFKAAELLCQEGEPSRSLFVVLAGELAVSVNDVELARVRPVDVIGEMGVVTDQPRCATVRAVADTRVLEIGKPRFDVAVGMDVDLAARLYRNLLVSSFGKLKYMNDHLSGCHGHDGGFGAVL